VKVFFALKRVQDLILYCTTISLLFEQQEMRSCVSGSFEYEVKTVLFQFQSTPFHGGNVVKRVLSLPFYTMLLVEFKLGPCYCYWYV